MDDVILLGIVCIALCLYILALQHSIRKHRIALSGAMMVIEDIAEGNAVIEKTENGWRVRRLGDDETRG